MNVKTVIAGFEDDFSEIVTQFSTTYPTLRLSEFYTFWDKTLLDCLFANRYDPRELFEAITRINDVLINKLTDSSTSYHSGPKTFKVTEQLVALYFILCMYYKQPKLLARKIRFSCEDIISMKQLFWEQDSILPEGCKRDAEFALKKLLLDEAIHLVEDRRMYGPMEMLSRSMTSHHLLPPHKCNYVGPENYNDEMRSFFALKLEPGVAKLDRESENYENFRSLMYSEDKSAAEDISVRPRNLLDETKSLISDFKSKYM